jgi:hypothetical protein
MCVFEWNNYVLSVLCVNVLCVYYIYIYIYIYIYWELNVMDNQIDEVFVCVLIVMCSGNWCGPKRGGVWPI